MTDIPVLIRPNGQVHRLYNDASAPLDGERSIKRRSNIEFDNVSGLWHVTIDGWREYCSTSRELCVQWEHEFFCKHPERMIDGNIS